MPHNKHHKKPKVYRYDQNSFHDGDKTQDLLDDEITQSHLEIYNRDLGHHLKQWGKDIWPPVPFRDKRNKEIKKFEPTPKDQLNQEAEYIGFKHGGETVKKKNGGAVLGFDHNNLKTSNFRKY